MTILNVWMDITGINPQPWTAPNVTRAKGGRIVAIKGGQNEAYQKALQEEMVGANVTPFPDMPLHVRFYFWRNTEKGQPADATNLLKATEDALQNYLYQNDRGNHHVEGCIIEQSPETEGRVLVHVTNYEPPFPADFEPNVIPELKTLAKMDHHSPEREADAEWRAENDPAADF